MVYSTRRFVLCLTLCYFVLVFFSHFSIASASLGERGANLSAFRTFVRFVLVSICRFSSIAITSLLEERANFSAFRTFVRLRLFGFVCCLFLLVSGKGCGL